MQAAALPGRVLAVRAALLFALLAGIPFLAFGALFAFAFRGLRGVELLRRREIFAAVLVLAFQHRIFKQIALDFLLHFDGRKLQQFDRLLQLGRQRQVLGKFELECRLHQ